MGPRNPDGAELAKAVWPKFARTPSGLLKNEIAAAMLPDPNSPEHGMPPTLFAGSWLPMTALYQPPAFSLDHILPLTPSTAMPMTSPDTAAAPDTPPLALL